MIFKKIYTFLNDHLNGNNFSKSFLVFAFIASFFCNSLLVISISSASIVLQAKPNKGSPEATAEASGEKVNTMLENILKPSSASYVTTGTNVKNHILYQKRGLPDAIFYTSYYPPRGTYNSNPSTEHNLPPCGENTELYSIGKDCMIKIPFDCSTGTLPTGASPIEGTNCLRYANIFKDNRTKKLKPQKCTGSTNSNKINCINPDLEYCHLKTESPIIGINCKLAPCNFIANDKYRRPGVNCMADCNETAGKHISNDIFFIEGFNCLPSCKTLSTNPKLIGENCVLEINEYVMPSCNNNFNNDFYLSRSGSSDASRTQCLDVIDLPLCSSPLANGEVELANCVKACNVSLNRHGVNCVNFYSADSASFGGSIRKKCHHYDDLATLTANPTCEKIYCHNLSYSELKNSLNDFDPSLPGFSTQKFCKTSKYSNFSVNQINFINSASNTNKYLKEYILPDKPCYTEGDSEEIEAVLSNEFFKNDQSYTAKFESLKNHCKSSANLGCTDDKLNPSHTDFDISLLYDTTSYCTFADTSQQISCADYRRYNGVRPYDCNSKSFSSTSCPNPSDPSCTAICATGELYCFKNSLNCNSSKNAIYPICTALKTTNIKKTDDEDKYVSWFFRPTLSYASYRQPPGTSDIFLVNMIGDPLSTTPLTGKPTDNLYMRIDDVDSNGYINSFWGTAYGGFSPGSGNDLSVGSVGTASICGMNGNYRGIPNDEFAYIKGEVQTVYELDNKVSHNVEICLRYVASNGPTHSCGFRKCEVTCSGRVLGFSGSCTKACGYDVCKTLSIKEGPGVPAGGCESSSDNFNNDLNGKDCVSSFKTNADIMSAHVRARIYKPESDSDYICAVIDFKGITTDQQTRPYFNGSEFFTVPDINKKGSTKKLCVSGTYNETEKACQFGVDSNSSDSNTDVWRVAKIVKYISSPVYNFNYVDQYGIGPSSLRSLHTDNETGLEVNQTIGRVNFNIKRYFETSDCIRHKSRISAPVYFSEPTIMDSERLFLPQIQINKVCSIATGTTDCIENVVSDEEPETDFFKPAIEILYGRIDAQYPVSNNPARTSATNLKVVQINDANQQKSEDYTIFARNIGITTTDDLSKIVFIKKENQGLQPKLCLYEKFGSGPTLKETLIRCINRKKPKNASITAILPESYNQVKFTAKFLKNSGTEHNSINDNSLSGINFTFIPITSNPKEISELKKCSQIVGQGYPICIQREECSVLNNECVTNEKDLIDARNTSPLNYQLIASKEIVSNYCKNELLPRCNSKKGFALTYSNQTLNTSSVPGVGFNAPASGNNYGWFNEVCIVSGVESIDNPVFIEELIPENGSLAGKCNRYSNDISVCANCDNSTNCTKGADCCKIYSITSPNTVNKRIATPRELGFCVDIRLYLNTCPAVSFVNQINLADPYFISPSNLGSLVTDPHISHVNRFLATNHAEFDVAYEGNNDVKGRCVGFYKNKYEAIYPSANCSSRGWDYPSEGCVLYSCPARKLGVTNDADSLGKYPSSYDTSISEKGSLRGSNEGYANWDSLNLSRYRKESARSSSCIAGYRMSGSIAQKNPINAGSPALSSQISAYRSTLNYDFISSLYGTISGYTGGNVPERKCNQLGKWEEVTNPCERITCPPILIDQPVEAGAVNMNDFDLVAISIRNKKIMYSDRSPFSPSGLSNPSKIKIITGSAQTAPIYFNLFANTGNISTASSSDLIIKTPDGANASLEANKTYVMEKIAATQSAPEYWKIIPNPNDEILKALWIKSGGAIFRQGAYAYRSPTNLYLQDTSDIRDIHEVTGECNASMGFSQISSDPPKITCDSKGNWTYLKNICISSCAGVSSANANDISHGFSTWNEITNIRVGESREVEATGCYSPSFKKYSYPPLFDSEGVRKDFYNSQKLYATSDTYDAVISSVDGANFTVNNPVLAGVNLADSDDNKNGTSYNFKVSNAGLSSSLVSSPYSNLNPLNVFYLFDDAQTLSISAPNNNIWSKINFSSYGTPYYADTKEAKGNCHSDYSKLILASKCIGKTNCNISLSDFENYDTLTCPAFALGNGSNGITTTNPNLGSSGGGGGGNIAGSGGSLVNPIDVNGSSGSSYYDKNFHLIYPTLSDGNNKGLKVDLTSNTNSQFNGGNGSVIIEESPDSSFSQTESTSYTNVGENIHTVELGASLRRAGSNDVYIRYVMIGGGGGGGAPGLTKGTNGASGTKMTGGVFIVKSGTTLKIHVGGGGKAGKTKCSRILSNLDPQLINPAIEILEPVKEINFAVKTLKEIGSFLVSDSVAQNSFSNDNVDCSPENYLSNSQQRITQNSKKFELNSIIKNSLKEIFNKISDIFISEAYAETRKCGNSYNHGDTMSTTACSSSGWDYGDITTTCYCPNEGTGVGITLYEHPSANSSKSGDEVSYYGEGLKDLNNPYDWMINETSSFYFTHKNGVYYMRARFNCYNEANRGEWTIWYYSSIANLGGYKCRVDGSEENLEDNIDQVQLEYYRDCGSGSTSSYNNCGCNAGRYYNNSTRACTPFSCKVNGITGFGARNIGYSTNSVTVACDANYSGSVTYGACDSNGKTLDPSGTCNANACTVASITGFDSTSLAYGASAVSANCKSGYSGKVSYGPCSTPGGSLTPSRTCTAITACDIPTGNGHLAFNISATATRTAADAQNLNGTRSTNVDCQNTGGYSGGPISFSCNDSGNLTAGNCLCATGYSRSDTTANTPCTANFCASTATGNGYNSVAVTATATISCNLAGYAGSVTATCSTNGGKADVTGSCTCTEGYYQTSAGAVCDPIECTSSGVSVGTANTNLPYTNSSYTPRRTVPCISPYSGTAEYTCTASTPPTSTTGIFTITKNCSSCVSGYNMVIGVCTANSCDSIAPGNGYTSKQVSGIETITCNTTGYAGSVTATCLTGTNVASVTGGCTCAEGYYQTAPGAVCNPITCNANGAGYSYKTGLSYTLGTSTSTFDCDEDYYGTVTYKCNGTGALTKTATIINSSCVKVTCPLPPNSNLAGDSVNFAKIATNYGCGNGYKQQRSLTFSLLYPKYTCTKNTDPNAQFNPSKLTTSNECIKIICYESGIEYEFTDNIMTEKVCVAPDKWGSEIYSCDSEGKISFSQICDTVYCPVPSGRNLFYQDANFPYSGDNFININCAQGYYYKECPAGQTSNCGRPSFRCAKDPLAPANTQPGVLTMTGVCSRTKCLLPTTGENALNSSIDGNMVDWSGPGNFVNLSCNNGFYQSDPSLPPQYSCFGNNQEIGNLITLNSCLPITCSIGDQVGLFAKNNLQFGEEKTINCDKPGFSNSLKYNCRSSTPPAPVGILTIVQNDCTESSCNRSRNNLATFTSFVSTSAQAGGLGGTISTSNFLKGGQGGNASNDFVNGSGGGGGSASMITIDKRIIAIAGGGGGGGGGGGAENNNEAVAKTTNLDLSYVLNSNIFGKYFVGEMQFNPIQGSDPSRTSGIIKAQNAGNSFNLQIPTGMYVNDIIFASYGNPTIDFTGSNLKLKKGSLCHDTNSIAVSENQCLSKKTCLFNTDNPSIFLNSACRSPNTNFGMVASYYFQEPTLFVNKGNSVPTSSQITEFTFKLKQYDPRTSNFVPASDLINNNIYNFSFENNTWIKRDYLDDEYYISEASSESEDVLKVRFHRTNTSFAPTLRTGRFKRTIVRPANNSLSVGFIKVNKDYILRKSGGDANWTIREFGDEEVSALSESDKKLPQRTCMTKQTSSLGTVGILWSRPDTMCTNFCPGATLNLINPGDDKIFDETERYNFSDRSSYYLVGDDRIGVGVTKHELSDGFYYMYWGNQSLNSWQVRKFRRSDFKIRNNNNDRKLLISESNFTINSSNFRKSQTEDDRNPTDKDYLILARRCDASGQWEAPISLCSTVGSFTESSKAPSIDGNSYFDNISNSDLTRGNDKYVMQSDSSSYTSSCLDGFKPQTTDHIYFSRASNIVSAPIYQCTTKPGGKINEVYFKKIGGFNCKQYCHVDSLTPAKKIEFKIKVSTTLNEYYVRPTNDSLDASSPSVSSGSLTVECQDGKFPRLKADGTRSSDNPKITCVRDISGALNWQKDPTYQCYDGRTCLYNSLTELDGIDIPRFLKNTKCVYTFDKDTYKTLKATSYADITTYITTGETCPPPSKYYILKSSTPSYNDGNKDVWFTLNKYIKREHQTNGLAHGAEEKFGEIPQCGYVVSSYGISKECASFDRKYLKSYSCNDGTWVPIWNNSDADWHKSCNGTGDTCTFNDVKEEAVPTSAWLGWITSDKNDMFTRKYSLFPNPKGSCDTCIGDPPPPAKTPEQIAAEAQAAADAAAALEEEKKRVMYGGGGY